jgi:hypothetical protein
MPPLPSAGIDTDHAFARQIAAQAADLTPEQSAQLDSANPLDQTPFPVHCLRQWVDWPRLKANER